MNGNGLVQLMKVGNSIRHNRVKVGQFFFIIDLREIFFRFRVGGGGGKALKISFFFFNISRTNSKTSNVNQHSVLIL